MIVIELVKNEKGKNKLKFNIITMLFILGSTRLD